MLDKFPLSFLDESQYASPSLSLLEHGNFGNKILPPLYGLEISTVVFGRIYMLLNAGIFYLLGYGLHTIRLLSFLSGIWLCYLTFKLGKKLFHEKMAYLATTLLITSFLFFIKHHSGRPDILVSCFMLWTILQTLKATETHRLRDYFLSGLLAALTLDVQATGIIVVAVWITTLFVYRKLVNAKQLLAAGIGLAIGGLWWFTVHMALNWEIYFKQWEYFWVKDAARGISLFEAGLIPSLAGEFKKYFVFFWVSRFHRNLLLAASLIASWSYLIPRMRSNKNIQTLLSVTFTSMLAQVVLNNKSDAYMINTSPLWMLCVAAFITDTPTNNISALSSRIWGGLKKMSLAFLLILASAEHIYLFQFRNASYKKYIEKIRNELPREATLLADAAYWPGLKDFHFISNFYLISLPAETPEHRRRLGKTFGELVRNFRITHIVADHDLGWSIKDPKFGFQEFLSNSCQLTAQVRDEFYGCTYATFRQSKSCTTKIYKVTPKL